VPTRLIGARVPLPRHDGRLQVVEPATGEIVADHQLVAPGGLPPCRPDWCGGADCAAGWRRGGHE
jgi:hypothetical protein